jgi:hypothetical protein
MTCPSQSSRLTILGEIIIKIKYFVLNFELNRIEKTVIITLVKIIFIG